MTSKQVSNSDALYLKQCDICHLDLMTCKIQYLQFMGYVIYDWRNVNMEKTSIYFRNEYHIIKENEELESSPIQNNRLIINHI